MPNELIARAHDDGVAPSFAHERERSAAVLMLSYQWKYPNISC